MSVSVNISKGRLVLRAKDDTYLSVRTYLSGHESNLTSKYEMQADERDTHERKLLNSIESAVSTLKSELYRFNVSSSEMEDDVFSLTYNVSSRFDTNKEKELARLTEDYLYKKIVYDWWNTNYPDSARLYQDECVITLSNLKKCLSLMYAPSSTEKYTYESEKGKHTININKEEIRNSFHNEMLKISRTMVGEDGLPDFNLQTNETEGYELINSYIQHGILRCSEILTAYLYAMVDGEQIMYALDMPCTWRAMMLPQLCDECFNYILTTALYEYLIVVYPQSATVYKEKAEMCRRNVKHAITARDQRFIHKPLQPF